MVHWCYSSLTVAPVHDYTLLVICDNVALSFKPVLTHALQAGNCCYRLQDSHFLDLVNLHCIFTAIMMGEGI